ncbi:hypothetical protein [Hyperthermus butylicus]|uniref:Lipoate--protein ligase n=1 Tax=Hyperthermus butylicus (strain DSM 5456 / JCM 9403 / PLM1-5) TaxID=415426 RepID=A2BN72_HYPBU|nr:hypothetical protein [Hyperthermus butylicus]ABM81433.1 hypothetical protein Hbut_1615 [Hyperthermus butylicus DSM 5456]
MTRRVVMVERVSGGKTLEVVLEVSDGCRVARLVVAGDFFVYPEDVVEAVEEAAIGCDSVGCIRGRILDAGSRGVFVGVSLEDIADVVAKAFRELCGEGG